LKEVTGDLWKFPADIRVITTNGAVKKNGECVMGRGCAMEARNRWPHIAKELGSLLAAHGNHVFALGDYDGEKILSFPVKHLWYQKADLKLIADSAQELLEYVSEFLPRSVRVVLPRPGCGNGGLDWDEVQPILAPILDDRFSVITFAHNTHYFNHNEV
jgi:hypothetical protein